MRFQGHNILAIILAALVIYGLEFLLYAVLISPDQFQAMSGMTILQGEEIGTSRMPYGIVMPVLAAIGLSFAIKWRQRPGMASGAITAAIMALCFGFGSRLYGYVYGVDTELYLAIDFARYIVTYGIAGAIIGAWR